MTFSTLPKLYHISFKLLFGLISLVPEDSKMEVKENQTEQQEQEKSSLVYFNFMYFILYVVELIRNYSIRGLPRQFLQSKTSVVKARKYLKTFFSIVL